MAVHVATSPRYYVRCDGCDNPAGDMGVPVEMYFGTEEEAIDDALNSDWTRTNDGRLLCPAHTSGDPD